MNVSCCGSADRRCQEAEIAIKGSQIWILLLPLRTGQNDQVILRTLWAIGGEKAFTMSRWSRNGAPSKAHRPRAGPLFQGLIAVHFTTLRTAFKHIFCLFLYPRDRFTHCHYLLHKRISQQPHHESATSFAHVEAQGRVQSLDQSCDFGIYS
jgi:hypothetical protein